jgi:hypothetical protein
MAHAFVTAAHIAVRHSLQLKLLNHRKFNGVGSYLRHASAGGANLIMNASDLPVPLVAVTNASQRSWNRGPPFLHLAPGVAYVNLVNSGMRWEGTPKETLQGILRNTPYILLFAGNADIYALRATGLFDWHEQGLLQDEAQSKEYDHCVLRYAMNVKPRITLPPRSSDVLIGIHIRSVRFLRDLGDQARSKTNASQSQIYDDNYALDVNWAIEDFESFAADARKLEEPGRSAKWFVLSDSPSLLALLRHAWRDRVIDWDSRPAHVANRSPGLDLSSQYRDWLMLSACDHIVCSGSQYSTSARQYSGTVQSVFSHVHAYGGSSGHPASRTQIVVVDGPADGRGV